MARGADLEGPGGVDLADALVANRLERLEAEARGFGLVAAWCDEHDEQTVPATAATGRARPAGAERARKVGADGTPLVAEFACAELGVLLHLPAGSAGSLMRDALDVRHRHPRLWEALRGLRAQVWQARHVARRVHAAGLSLEQARWVDAQTTPYVETLPWYRFTDLVEAKIVEADPAAAQARVRARALEQFVATGQCNEFGLKTVVAKAQAGDVIFFVAMCERIAQVLLLKGNAAPLQVRRAAAIGILAHPHRAAALLEEFALTDTGTVPPPAPAEDDTVAVPVGEHEMHPCDNDADDEPSRPPGLPRLRLDPDLCRPAATLYVHMSEHTLRAATQGEAGGVVRAEDAGVVTAGQVQDWLGHAQVRMVKVLDLAGQVPVDGYEVPAAMAEAVEVRNPFSVAPYGTV
jgi:hypothetical protein